MRRLPLCLLVVLTACAGGGGSWPTLARRPIEGPTGATVPTGRCAAVDRAASCLPASPAAPASAAAPPPTVPAAAGVTGLSPAEPMVAPPPVATEDIAPRLAVIDRDLGDAAARLAAQRTAATAAAAAARGTGADSAAWSKAQLELTAFDKIGSQLGDIRARLDAVAGTLAAASAGGGDIAALLTATGRLVARTTALQADYEATAAALR